jgi:hypothetical protein
MSALKSIRKKCLSCTKRQLKLCNSPQCPLYEYRWGKMPRIDKPSPLKAIRARCLDCVGLSPSEVKNCADSTCELYVFRFGSNPNYSDRTRQRRRELYLARLEENTRMREHFSRDLSEDEAEHAAHDLSRMVTS